MYDAFKNQLPDIDPEETTEWLEALDAIVDASPARARFLLHRVLQHARSRQIGLPAMVSTDSLWLSIEALAAARLLIRVRASSTEARIRTRPMFRAPSARMSTALIPATSTEAPSARPRATP